MPIVAPHKTRLAPSPTGHLHLGHALHIMCVQGISESLGASISLRLEDHDRGRCRPEFELSIIRDLEWLGVEVPTKLWRQSERHSVYQSNLENLMSRGLIYACACSRKDIQSDIAQDSGELRYPGTCRDKDLPLDQPNTSLRLRLPDASETFHDLILGGMTHNPSEQCGDVMIRDRAGQWTYQFAVVIDDLEQEINLVIRGVDLLSSTARQLAMRKILDQNCGAITFAHHPLIRNMSGQKLSKRIFSEGIAKLRDEGFSADQVRGIAAHLGGLTKNDQPVTQPQIKTITEAAFSI